MRVLKLLSLLCPVSSTKVLVVDRRPLSGSSALVLFKQLSTIKAINSNYYSYSNRSMFARIAFAYHLMSSKVIVVTHSPLKLSRNQICVQMWHGMPIKGVGINDPSEKKTPNQILERAAQADYYVSSSRLYSSIISSSFGVQECKFKYTSFPRLDLMLGSHDDSSDKITKDFGLESYDNIFVYMPTFRSGDSSINGNIIESQWYKNTLTELRAIDNWLCQANSVMVVKFHPNDEELINPKSFESFSSCVLVKSDDLQSREIDFYSFLSISSCLITDFSSVLFDYLVLDRPVVIYSSDSVEYISNRSLNFNLSELAWLRVVSDPAGLINVLETITSEGFVVPVSQKYFKERFVQNGLRDTNSSRRLAQFVQGLLCSN